MAAEPTQAQAQAAQQVAQGGAPTGVPAAAPQQMITALYVGDLNPDVTEANLFEKFSPVGQVQTIRVCRDTITRRSLGYAYVNFVSAEDAARALDTMNGDAIRGRPCRIMWSQRDPSMRRSGVGNVYIKNLAEDIDSKALYDTFSDFGNILSCKVQTDETGKSRGYGFVHYETQAMADRAIAEVSGKLIHDKIVYLAPFKTHSERQEELGKAKREFKNVFVKNFPSDLTGDKFLEIFSRFGKITSWVLAHKSDGADPQTTTRYTTETQEADGKGFGFVAYDEPAAAAAAVAEMNEKDLDGKKLFVGRAMKKKERELLMKREYERRRKENVVKTQSSNLYVKNLEEGFTDDQLRAEFAGCGVITSAKVMTTDKGVSRGFGFVCFATPEEATKAVTDMNGKMVGNKPLYVAVAQRKEDRRQQLAAAYHHRMMAQRMQMPMGMMQQQQMYMGQVPYGGRAVTPAMFRGRGGPFPQQMYPPQQGYPPRSGYAVPPHMAGGRPGAVRGAAMGGMPRMPQQRGPVPQAGPRRPQGQQQPPFNRGAPQQPQRMPQQEPLTAAALIAAPPEQQKQMLGERLFPLIAGTYPDLAAKITGMLLEMDNSELLHLLEDQSALQTKVGEALRVLQEHAQATGMPLPGGAPQRP